MIGTDYVGLVSGVCFSDFGHEVVCVDKDAGKIDRLNAGEVPIYEPGLDTLMAKNVDSGRLFRKLRWTFGKVPCAMSHRRFWRGLARWQAELACA